MLHHIPRPQEGEYAPYTIAYISKVPDDEGDVLTHLTNNDAIVRDHIKS